MSVRLKRLTSFTSKDAPEGLEGLRSPKGPTRSIYAVPLPLVLERYGGPIPPIIKFCTRRLRSNLEEEGLFRVSGLSSAVYEIGELFVREDARPDLSEYDCHTVASAYKKFFRDLPQPLFPTSAYEAIVETAKNDGEELLEPMKQLMLELPIQNYLIARYVIKFLYQTSKSSEKNKMEADNLGIVFGPTLLRSQKENDTGVGDLLSGDVTARAITKMIVHYKEIFKDLVHPGALEYKESNSRPHRGRSMTHITTTPRLIPVGADLSLTTSSGTITPRRMARRKRKQSRDAEFFDKVPAAASSEPTMRRSMIA